MGECPSFTFLYDGLKVTCNISFTHTSRLAHNYIPSSLAGLDPMSLQRCGGCCLAALSLTTCYSEWGVGSRRPGLMGLSPPKRFVAVNNSSSTTVPPSHSAWCCLVCSRSSTATHSTSTCQPRNGPPNNISPHLLWSEGQAARLGAHTWVVGQRDCHLRTQVFQKEILESLWAELIWNFL